MKNVEVLVTPDFKPNSATVAATRVLDYSHPVGIKAQINHTLDEYLHVQLNIESLQSLRHEQGKNRNVFTRLFAVKPVSCVCCETCLRGTACPTQNSSSRPVDINQSPLIKSHLHVNLLGHTCLLYQCHGGISHLNSNVGSARFKVVVPIHRPCRFM